MPELDRQSPVTPMCDWSRGTLDRVPPIELHGAWMFAQADCTLALAAWRSAAGQDKRDAYAAYVAALDREAQAAIVLASRLAGPGEGREGAPSVSPRVGAQA